MKEQSPKYSIEWLLEIKKLDKKEVAKKMNISLRTLNRWCSYSKNDTRSMSFDNACDLAKILDVEVHLLMYNNFAEVFVSATLSIALGLITN